MCLSRFCKVYGRVQLEDMATSKEYTQWGKEYGVQCVELVNNTKNIKMHYEAVMMRYTVLVVVVVAIVSCQLRRGSYIY